MDHFDTFERTLASCIDAMFSGDDGGTSCGGAEPPAPSDTDVVFASIGFACDGARGSLLLLANTLEAVTEEVHCDFLGELANMLVGRMKNQLLNHGVELLFGTPMTATARAARVLATTEPMGSTWFRVDRRTGPLFVRLDACFDATFELGEEAIRSAGTEGDMLFF